MMMPTIVYTQNISANYCERSVAVITRRCQRRNPGSNPGARIPHKHMMNYLYLYYLYIMGLKYA
jgi:hypothetical protein